MFGLKISISNTPETIHKISKNVLVQGIMDAADLAMRSSMQSSIPSIPVITSCSKRHSRPQLSSSLDHHQGDMHDKTCHDTHWTPVEHPETVAGSNKMRQQQQLFMEQHAVFNNTIFQQSAWLFTPLLFRHILSMRFTACPLPGVFDLLSPDVPMGVAIKRAANADTIPAIHAINAHVSGRPLSSG